MTLRATESSRRYNAIHDIRGQPLQPKSPACLLIHSQLLYVPTDCRDQLIEFSVDSLGIQYQYSTTQPNQFSIPIHYNAIIDFKSLYQLRLGGCGLNRFRGLNRFLFHLSLSLRKASEPAKQPDFKTI